MTPSKAALALEADISRHEDVVDRCEAKAKLARIGQDEPYARRQDERAERHRELIEALELAVARLKAEVARG